MLSQVSLGSSSNGICKPAPTSPTFAVKVHNGFRNRAIPFVDVGCQPSYPESGTVISLENRAYIVFSAITLDFSDRGFLEDLGVAVVTCDS